MFSFFVSPQLHLYVIVPPAVQVAAVSLCFTQLWVWAGGALVFCGVGVGCGVAVFFGVAVGFGDAVFFGVAVALGVADGFGVAVAPAELLCEAPSGVLPGTPEEDAAGEDSGTAGAVPAPPDASGPDEGRPPVPSSAHSFTK